MAAPKGQTFMALAVVLAVGLEEGALRVLLDGGEEVLVPQENVVLARQEITVSRAKERGNRVV